MKGLLVIDTERCVGCHSCELNCAVAHSESRKLFAAIFERPLPRNRVTVEHYRGTNIPLQCRHCEEAPCLKVCPTEAISKAAVEEPVLIDESLCIGCKWCLLVCPFGAVSLGREGQNAVLKCDLCQDHPPEYNVPACVYSCPTGALQFLSAEEYAREKRREFLVDYLESSEKQK